MQKQWKQKRSTIHHYDQTAPTYDSQYKEEQETKIQATLENLNIDHNAVVLDAGCGTGLLFNHITNQARLTVGIDTSLALLKQARTKSKIYDTTHIIRADADHQPFKTNTFTHTFACTLIQNTPNPTRTLEELRRVTKPNATIIITALKKHFLQKDYIQLLTNAKLEITTLRTDEKLKDYIAICAKRL
jgi:ubiquinone/menaquinone biosynthesis C-methylase UbiE